MDWWYYSNGVNQIGPISQEEFEDLVKQGEITSETMVWTETMKKWQKYGEIVKDGKYIIQEEELEEKEVGKEGLGVISTLTYAGFGERVVASFFDSLVLQIINVFISFFLVGYNSKDFTFFNIVIPLVVSALYEIFLTGKYGATLGKIVLGIKVVTPLGEDLDYGRSAVRYLAKIVSGLTLGIGYLMVAFDEEKKGLHDRIAGTRVIKK